MAVVIYSEKICNHAASHASETKREIRSETNKLENRAEDILTSVRASTQWHKIVGPSGQTTITSEMADVDGYVHLNADNAMAIEFGHDPSGVFGPGRSKRYSSQFEDGVGYVASQVGRYGRTESKAPEGLYILTRAANG